MLLFNEFHLLILRINLYLWFLTIQVLLFLIHFHSNIFILLGIISQFYNKALFQIIDFSWDQLTKLIAFLTNSVQMLEIIHNMLNILKTFNRKSFPFLIQFMKLPDNHLFVTSPKLQGKYFIKLATPVVRPK